MARSCGRAGRSAAQDTAACLPARGSNAEICAIFEAWDPAQADRINGARARRPPSAVLRARPGDAVERIAPRICGLVPSCSRRVSGEFERKLAAQARRDELEEQARAFALTQSYAADVAIAVRARGGKGKELLLSRSPPYDAM